MLSVLIVSWNTRELLRACLDSIAAHPPTDDYEVIVVDNASTDGTAEMLRESFHWVDLVASPLNTGYARGNNLAFARARGDWILTLNPDTEAFADTFRMAEAEMLEHPEAGCLGARQISARDGSTQASIRGFPSVRGLIGDLSGLGRRLGGKWDSYRLTRFDYDSQQVAPQPMGTFLLFRRQALASVGDAAKPFDESFPIFFNEVDLLFRLSLAGWPCIYCPSVRILHHGGESTKQVRSSMIWESHRSLLRYFRKHYGTGIARVGLAFLAGILYVSAFVRARGYHAGFGAKRNDL